MGPGTGGEDSKFRPVPEPRSPDGASVDAAEIVVDIDSRHHLNWATQYAATFVADHNDWTDPILHQGVIEAVWVVPTTYRHNDETDPGTALTTAEGSSRVTAFHAILGQRSSDVPYDEVGSKFRARIKRVNDVCLSGPNQEDVFALRCERVPAIVIVGFEPFAKSATSFPTALRSLVALRHVDPPTARGEGPENEALSVRAVDGDGQVRPIEQGSDEVAAARRGACGSTSSPSPASAVTAAQTHSEEDAYGCPCTWWMTRAMPAARAAAR